jgi:hypothetical protein
MVCFLALVLESALQRKLLEKMVEVEYIYLLRDLKALKAVELNIGEEKYLCRTELAGKAYEAFKALGMRPPLQVAVLDNTRTSTALNEPDHFIPSFFD